MDRPNSRLHGKTAFITGAAKRLGRITALTLADAGCNVIVHYNRSEADALDTVREAEKNGVKAWSLSADLTDSEETITLVDRASDMAGHIDYLVNNASVFPESRLADIDMNSLGGILAVNSYAPLVLSRSFARQAKKGAIVNIIDNRVDRIDLIHTAYQLSKNMLRTLTEMTAVEFAPGIRVNGVAPGLILPPPGKDVRYLGGLTKRTLLGRHGSPEDIAEAVLYLLSAEFVTGQVIVVDGGENLKRATYQKE